MTNSATRLTLYALLSSLEIDFRNIIKAYLDHHISTQDLLPKEALTNAIERFQKSYGVVLDPTTVSLTNLLYYVDIGDLYQVLNRFASTLPLDLAHFIKGSNIIFEKLIKVRNRVAHTRPLEMDDFTLIYDFSTKIIEKFPGQFSELKSTLEKLNNNPSYVLGLNIPYTEPDNAEFHNLPIPDFDETGFIGRDEFTRKLLKYISGPYPVITIVGEGGLGKTALALKVAYDVLDLPSKPFDAIIWSSAKTTKLTTTQIITIDNAIQSSLGLIENVSETLTGTKNSNALEEVISYMREFHILLILDNLETVIDNNIRNLMEDLPNGNKILITSRIGLGSYECPVKLTPLEEREAIALLRTLVRMRGVPLLSSLSNKKLSGYCAKMHNNPGYIKWFVSAIQAGQRPEDILDKPDLFLEFCMSNVHHYLSDNSKLILRSLQAMNRKLSQAELAFLNNIDTTILQRSLQELLSTNMVQMTSSVQGTSFESRYEISDLARDYLDIKHPLPIREHEVLTKRWRQLVAAGEQIAAEQLNNPFSYYSIHKRSNSDLIVAKYLLDTLNLIKQQKLDEANQNIKEARRLAPEYYEVHRVEAWLRTCQRNIPAAQNAYEAAIELQPNSAPVRLFYAGFLLRYFDDLEGALANINVAEEINPSAHQILLEKARILIYLMRYTEAKQIIDSLLEREDIDFWGSKKLHDLVLQYYQRYSEYCFSQHDNIGCHDALLALLKHYQSIPRRLCDEEMLTKLRKAMPTIRQCRSHLIDEEKIESIESIANGIEHEIKNGQGYENGHPT